MRSIPAHIFILTLIILVGIFFRTYNFSDWLKFQTDTLRDAKLVSYSVQEGSGYLPLLGPRAGGTQLHLGPIFYYFQYISGSIFQSTSPVVFAYPDLLFSILAIPLFFFLLREYFSLNWSLAITAMLATCFMAIEAGRFAWNPNSTPFFSLLFFFALLKAYNSEEKDCWKKYAWLSVSGGALAIASQMHFSAFLGLPIIFILFAIFNWKKTQKFSFWKMAIAFFGTIAIFYIPVIVFDVLTHGKNSLLFLDAIGNKGSGGNILQGLFRDVEIFSKYFLHILTGIEEGNFGQKIFGGVVLVAGFFANYFLIKKEKNEKKKTFLVLSLIFLVVFFLIYIPLAFEIKRPRFFLPLIFIPFMLVGYIFAFMREIGAEKKSKLVRLIAVFAVAFLILINVKSTRAWFYGLNESENLDVVSRETKRNVKVYWMWGRFEKAAAYMDENCEKDSILVVVSKKPGDYYRQFEYVIAQRDENLKALGKEKYKDDYEKYDSCFFYISAAKEDRPEFLYNKKHDESFYLGDMEIVRWYPDVPGTKSFPEEKPSDKNRSLEKKIKSKYPRILWGDLFK
ncbi:MAG TPA: hypothetical protein PLF30_03665 [Candidatus Moranbacteria bacterium]|nr:hypothetical protein [Candidatus Moranbacteria bacterium]HQB59795.1 hypothetical protein [Candidatus Moranbacteria bacterium]